MNYLNAVFWDYPELTNPDTLRQYLQEVGNQSMHRWLLQPDLDFWIKRVWPRESVVIKQRPHFLSCLIRETKVDVGIDPLSRPEKRPVVSFENGHRFRIDTIQSIVSHKLCACVSRTEPKDYVDLYVIFKKLPEVQFETVYTGAQA